MVDPSGPLRLMMRSQRAAAAALTDAVAALREVPAAGARPEQALQQLLVGAQALASLASASIKPMQDLLDRQREFGETMATFAAAQRHSADALDSLAKNQAAVVDAIETLFMPVIAAEAAANSAKRARSARGKQARRTASDADS
jgi:hypothetical protein